MTDEELLAIRDRLLESIDGPLEDLVATVRGQGGTTSALRIITWDEESSPTMASVAALPEKMVQAGVPFVVSLASSVLADLQTFGFSLSPEAVAEALQSIPTLDSTWLVVLTIVGGDLNIDRIDFPIIGASGGDA